MDEAALEEQKPEGSRRFLAMIEDARKAFSEWQQKVGNIEKRYASLKTMADANGDREMQLFWANLEVLKPTVYQRPPQPIVQQRFSTRNPVAREAAEMLERALSFDIEDDDLHETLKLVRDDLVVGARGVPWVLDNASCIHVDREDFVHEPARKWSEVGWVSRRAYVDRDSFKERFPKADHTKAKFEHQDPKDDGDSADYKTTGKKAQVWEIWHKSEQSVYWVTEGVEEVLDQSEPLIDVKGFFPCPKPAYGTLEPRTLKPVPDYVYYRDQLDEINELTARISSLAESLRLKGFYAAGVSEIGEAIEAAMKATDNKAILVPVSNMAALGGSGVKDSIVWLPIREVAEVITALVALRKQLIEDVYEISGVSDIMRGETVASETATAQNLKAQYGSVRVRERQSEMVRVARDVIRIKAEIYAEKYDVGELAQMAQMELPTMQAVQMAQMQGQQIDPAKLVTLDQIDQLLKSQKMRPYVLEVESDSTIAPNEQEEKQSRIEYVSAVGGFIQQALPMVQAEPATAKFAVEMLKFAAGAFRSGRELESAMDDFAQQIEARAAQAQQQQGQPTPEQQAEQAKVKAEAERQALERDKAQADVALRQEDIRLKAMDRELKGLDIQLKERDLGIKQQEADRKDAETDTNTMFRAAELEIEREQQRPADI